MVKAKQPLSALNCQGFTLAELLVALMVTSIVLAAIATLAFALGAAYETSDDTSQKQAQVRFATLRISELIRNCKLICCVNDNDMAIWRADDNDDGQINISELVYIEMGPSGENLQLCEFTSFDNSSINLGSIRAFSTNWWLAYSANVSYMRLIPKCNNVQFGFDVLPPWSRFVSISFDLVENDIVHRYQISAGLRGWAGYLLNQAGDGLVSDDD